MELSVPRIVKLIELEITLVDARDPAGGGQRSLVGYSPWGCKELDTTEAPEYTHR